MKFNTSVSHLPDGKQAIGITPAEGSLFAVIDGDQPRYATVGSVRAARRLDRPSHRLPFGIENTSMVQAGVFRVVEPTPEELEVFGGVDGARKFLLKDDFDLELARREMMPVGDSETERGLQEADRFPLRRSLGVRAVFEVSRPEPS